MMDTLYPGTGLAIQIILRQFILLFVFSSPTLGESWGVRPEQENLREIARFSSQAPLSVSQFLSFSNTERRQQKGLDHETELEYCAGGDIRKEDEQPVKPDKMKLQV